MFLKPGLGRFLTGESVPKVVLHGNGDNLWVEWVGSRARRNPLLEGPGRWGASITGCWGFTSALVCRVVGGQQSPSRGTETGTASPPPRPASS